MAGFEPRQNTRGNWNCPYCSHKSYKGYQSAVNHIRKNHEKEAAISEAKEEARLAKSRAEDAERRFKKQQEEKDKEERYSAIVYCPNCLSVDSVRIIYGQKVGEGGCFRCGSLGSMLVEQVNVNAGTYSVREK